MTNAIAVDRRNYIALALFAVAAILALMTTAGAASAAQVAQEDTPSGDAPRPVDEEARQEKVVVAPEPPHWSGWGDWHDWHPGAHRSAPRVKLWVDRGEWATYHPGDRLWVYFRVDRPCYVTILDYSPDGRVDAIFPSRWSGSNFVTPGRTYRIPESRRYSLRIAGAGGVETLVACAHEAPWPSGPSGVWIPQHRPHGGRVVVGRPGGSPPPGWRGRVVVGPGRWPVPPRWHDRPERWSCDSVSFYVATSWHDGGSWGHDGPWDEHRDSDWGWSGWNDRDWGDEWDRDGRYGSVLRDRFKMNDCSDRFSWGFDAGKRDGVVRIECVESSHGDPTEIVGRLSVEDHWGDEVLFRLDAEGRHGARPYEGAVYRGQWGRVGVEVEIVDLKLTKVKHWQVPRIKWIEFDVRVFRR